MIALIDTNVILDVLLGREPFRESSERVLAATERGDFEGYCCASTITDIFSIARRTLGANASRECIQELTKTIKIAPVTHAIVSEALSSKFTDFEDGVLHAAAITANASCIVTRNEKDFSFATIPVYTPPQFLEILSLQN